MNQLKICIICVYFGKLPTCFPLWLKSCQFNPTIDFLLVTDQTINHPLADNVHVLPYTLGQMRRRIAQIVGFEPVLERPYKCCDYRPLYSLIFKDQVQGYDYWGHCDMDMVFGDLAWFFKKYHLERYDRFQNVGHLILMRNTPQNNERYKLPCTIGKGYTVAFQTPESFHFDEKEINEIYRAYSFPFFDERVHADIAPEFRRMKLSFIVPNAHNNHKYQTFYWQNGKIWRAYIQNNHVWRGVCTEEYAYIHFQKRKMAAPDFDVNTTNAFYICQDHFEAKKELQTPSYKEIYRTNPYSLLREARDYVMLQWDRVRIKIKLLLNK